VFQVGVQPWTNDVRGILCFLQEFRGHDDVGVNRPERNAETLGRFLPPVLGFAHRIFVTDDQRWLYFVAKFQQAVIRIAAQHETNVSSCETLRDVRNAFSEESVMPQIGMRIERRRREEDHDRLP